MNWCYYRKDECNKVYILGTSAVCVVGLRNNALYPVRLMVESVVVCTNWKSHKYVVFNDIVLAADDCKSLLNARLVHVFMQYKF